MSCRDHTVWWNCKNCSNDRYLLTSSQSRVSLAGWGCWQHLATAACSPRVVWRRRLGAVESSPRARPATRTAVVPRSSPELIACCRHFRLSVNAWKIYYPLSCSGARWFCGSRIGGRENRLSSPRPRSRISSHSALAECISGVLFRPPFFVLPPRQNCREDYARCVSDDAFVVVLTEPPSLVNHFDDDTAQQSFRYEGRISIMLTSIMEIVWVYLPVECTDWVKGLYPEKFSIVLARSEDRKEIM